MLANATRLPDGRPFAELVLFDGDGVVVVNKPPGLPTTGRTLEDTDCLQWFAMQHFRRMVWCVHQLDADTSGALVLVRRKGLVPIWQERLQSPNAHKTYLAWLQGELAHERVEVRAPLGALDKSGRQLGVVETGKPAHTSIERLAISSGMSLCAITLHTGRTHQIRIHAQHIGHPLIGEEWYSNPPDHRHPRQALHAWLIRIHATPEQRFVAPVPTDLQGFHRAAGFSDLGGILSDWHDVTEFKSPLVSAGRAR
jgi:23S rRNA-/tRNA-specific pseudouridylate synthase